MYCVKGSIPCKILVNADLISKCKPLNMKFVIGFGRGNVTNRNRKDAIIHAC